MFVITKETYDIEVIVDNKSTLWLNEKHVEENLGHKNLVVITRNFCLDYRKHRFELVDKPKKQLNRMLLHKDLALKIIMDCRTEKSRNLKKD